MIKRLAKIEPAPPWGIPIALGMLVAMFAAIILGTTLAQLFLPETPAQPLAGWIIGGILTIFLVFITRRRTPEEQAALRLTPTQSPLPIIVLFSLGMAVLIDLISLGITGDFWTAPELLSFFSVDSENALLPFGNLTITAWALASILMVIVQPVAEELVLRGVMFPALRSSLGAWTGLLMSAIFHAAFHLLAYTAFQLNGLTTVWYVLVVPFLDGLVISCIRAYTGSTRAAIIAHAAFGVFYVLKALTLVG